MRANPSHKDGVVEEFYDHNQPVMIPVDIEDTMLLSRHIRITECLPDICKIVPLTSFNLCYPFLYCCLTIRMLVSIYA